MTLRWVIAGGGNGGHVTPALALVPASGTRGVCATVTTGGSVSFPVSNWSGSRFSNQSEVVKLRIVPSATKTLEWKMTFAR